MRVALKELKDIIATVDDEHEVVFGFDEAVLTIRCAGKILAMPGEGIPWAKHYRIRTGELRNLPKRLMTDRLGVSVWKTRLTIGQHSYAGVSVAESSEATNTKGLDLEISSQP
ncbi:MAG: hypothetical protein ABH852_05380 [Methanobacteriota archaeon]